MHYEVASVALSSTSGAKDRRLHLGLSVISVGSLLRVDNDAKYRENWFAVIYRLAADASRPDILGEAFWFYNGEDAKACGLDVLLEARGYTLEANELIASNSTHLVDRRTVANSHTFYPFDLAPTKDEQAYTVRFFFDVNTKTLHFLELPPPRLTESRPHGELGALLIAMRVAAKAAQGKVRTPFFFSSFERKN